MCLDIHGPNLAAASAKPADIDNSWVRQKSWPGLCHQVEIAGSLSVAALRLELSALFGAAGKQEKVP